MQPPAPAAPPRRPPRCSGAPRPRAPPAPAAPAPAAPAAPVAPAAPLGAHQHRAAEVKERLAAVGAISQAISAEVQKVIIGKSHIIDNVLINILSNGNLLEDYPGLAKTLMTNTFADALGCDFKRVQFTFTCSPPTSPGPTSTTPSGLPSSPDRCSATCSSLARSTVPAQDPGALLEAMQEKQVTIGTVTELPAPFIVMATQNPLSRKVPTLCPSTRPFHVQDERRLPRPSG